MDDKINHPSYYGGDTTYEAIKVIEAWKLEFNLGNTVKYISRAGKKGVLPTFVDDKEQRKTNLTNTITDLEKAKWYLEREIENLKKLVK